MNIFLFLIGLFFLFIIIYSIYPSISPSLSRLFHPILKEGLTPVDIENENTIEPISLTDLEKEVEDISGNVVNLKNQVEQIIISQGDYLSKHPLPEPNISLDAVS